MEGAKHLKRTRGDVIYDTVIFIILTIIFLLVAYPLYFVIISSFSDPVAVILALMLNSFRHKRYRKVIQAVTYAPNFISNRPITLFYIVTMFVGGGMMPTYLVVRDTGLLNSMWALILPGALGVYNMIVARTFFTTNIPGELMEAAKLDGCGNTKFFLYIVLPLSGAITAILFLYYGVGHWNSYFSALLYISDRKKWPLQMELRNILLQNSVNMSSRVLTEQELAEKERLEALKEMMKYSLIIISSIPVLVIYPFVQKHFVKGVMIGSVKG